MKLHHVQVSMPAGGEELARRFYRDAVGLIEVEKPVSLAGRGGCWFRSLEEGRVTAEIHVGVDDSVPGQKAHPALLVDDVEELDAMSERIAAAGFHVSWRERETFDGYLRFHARDGFGNRLEVLAAAP